MAKRSDGRYEAKVTIGNGSDGKPIVKHVYATTKKELEQKKKEMIAFYIEGDRSSTIKLFETYIIDWYEVRKKPFLSQGSRKQYASLINKHILPALGERNISAITAMDIQRFLNKLAEKYTHSTIIAIRRILHSVFESALYDGYIRLNPVKHVNAQGTPVKEKCALTEAQRASIEKVCREHEDGLLLAILYYTGMRGGEARALRWKDVDLKTRTISITASLKSDNGTYVGSTKNKSSIRKVPIVDPLFDILMAHPFGMPNSFVLHNFNNPQPIATNTYLDRFAALMQAAGLVIETEEGTKPMFTPHTLRHNMATICWENGIDAFTTAKLLGHSSIKTTMDTYTHLSQAGLSSAMSSLNDIYSKSRQKVVNNSADNKKST